MSKEARDIVKDVSVMDMSFANQALASEYAVQHRQELEHKVYRVPPNLSAKEIVAYCRQHLTNYKVPKQVEFRSELPKTPVGKILRRELRSLSLAAPASQPAQTGREACPTVRN